MAHVEKQGCHTDQRLALLDFRKTPTQGMGSSSSQCLLYHHTCRLLSMRSNLLKLRMCQMIRLCWKTRRSFRLNIMIVKHVIYLYWMKVIFTCNIEGNIVPYKKSDQAWKKGIINHWLDEHSFKVQTSSGTYWWNRCHLRNSSEPVKHDKWLATTNSYWYSCHMIGRKHKELHYL